MKISKTKQISLILIISSLSISACSKIKEPNYFTKKGHCVVNTNKQMQIGLNRFNTIEEFKRVCNSKMIFEFKKDECRLFTMKKMKFDIYIKDKIKTHKLNIGEEKIMCGKKVIEYIK